MIAADDSKDLAKKLSIARETFNLGASATTGSGEEHKRMDIYNDSIGGDLSEGIENIVLECPLRCGAALRGQYFETLE